jgi:uncharacterized protein YggE
MPSTVHVRGNAVVPVQPDEVELTLELNHIAGRPDAALSEVAARSEELERLFAELQLGRERWTTSGVSLHEEYERNRTTGEQTLRGFKAVNVVALRLRDASIVGHLMSEAARRSQARISGPSWRIAPDNPGWAEARRRAALDARQKAEEYVEALGARLGSVIEIAEPGIPQPRPPQPMGARMLATAMDASPELTVQAGTLEISTSVNVIFGVEQSG